MKIKLNNIPTELSSNKLHDLLSDKELLDKGGIAVAVNNNIVPKAEWEDKTLNENDELLIITAAQGG